MIKHMVMWRIQAPEGQDKQVVLETLKEELEKLKGQIDGLLAVEVGLNNNTSDAAYDAVLYLEFTDQEALENYQAHEKHQYVANHFVRPYAVSRAVVDYEC